MAHFKDLISNTVIRLFGKLLVNKDASFTGVVECDNAQIDSMTLGSKYKGLYVSDGELKQATQHVRDFNCSFYEERPAGVYLGTQTTLNGNISTITFQGKELYTNPSGEHADGIELYSFASQSYPTLRFLTNRNWREMITMDANGVEAGDGTIYLTRKGATAGSFTLNQSKDVTIDIPNSVQFKTIDASYTSQFRTETYGANEIGSYLAVIRNNTASVSAAPQYGSGLAWGYGSNNAYFMTSYNGANAYIGGGSGNRLSWVSEVAWYSDIPSTSSKMDKAASNATSAAFKSIFDNNSTVATTALGELQTTYGYVDGTFAKIEISDIADYLSAKTNQTIYATPHIMNRNNLAQLSEYWFTIWTESRMYQYERSPIVIQIAECYKILNLNITKSFIYIDRRLCTNSEGSKTSGVISTTKLPTFRIRFQIPIMDIQDGNEYTISFQGFGSNVTNLFGNGRTEVEFPSTPINIPTSAYKINTSNVAGIEMNCVCLELTFHLDWNSSQIAANTSSGCFNRTCITYQWV